MSNRFRRLIVNIRQNKILLFILVCAAILRFVGTNPGYNQFHADEGISYSAAVSMIKDGNLDPLRYDYPALVPILNNIAFRLIFIPFGWTRYYLRHIFQILDGTVHIPISDVDAKGIFQVAILGERNINALIWGRYVTAFFSLGCVYLTYLVAKKYFNEKVGLIAAFLLTFNFKHVVNSHIGLPDIYNSFFVLLVFLVSYNLWKRPSTRNYFIAGLVAGLSLSVKYQVFGFAPLMLSHLYASLDDKKRWLGKLFSLRVVLLFALSFLLFLLINPYHFLYLDKTIGIVKGVSEKYAMGVKKINLYPFSYFYHIDYGPIEFFMVWLGIIVSVWKFFRKTLVFLSYAVPFVYVFLYYSNGGFYVRNFINITPLFFILAAVGVWWVYSALSGKVPSFIRNICLIVFLLAAVFIPAKNSIINSINYTKPWGYSLMRPWIQTNLPKNVVVAAHPFDAVNLGIKNKRTEFEVAGAYSMAEHMENGASYAVVDLNWAGNPFYFWMGYGFSQLKYYWNKPVDIMRNTFHGIAIEELFRYSIHFVSKPWQAPDTHLFVAKFPTWDESSMNRIKSYNFDSGLDSWRDYGGVGQSSYAFDDRGGKDSSGSILFSPLGSVYPGERISSPTISVKEGYLYKVEGSLKTADILDSDERDGFLRVDFYGDSPSLEKVGVASSLSSRVYGTNEWVFKSVVERAPFGAKYMTVSFEMYNTSRTKVWLDNVFVSESAREVPDVTSKPPYEKGTLDFNYLYPNSHGNL